MRNKLKASLKISLLTFTMVSMFSCSKGPNDTGTQYAPQMYDDPSYEALKQADYNKVNPGRMNMRVPAKNTIPRGKLAYFNHIPKNDSLNQADALKNPFVANAQVLEEGQVLYERFCQHCHGAEGKGDGKVGVVFKGVANLQSDAIKAASMGHIYHVITNGKGRMMPHGSQVNPEERWKIALYVKNTLQGAGEQATEVNSEAATEASSSDGDNVQQSTGTPNSQ
ncbi:cytochrome c class I [Adhaeribacter arboris]|uniref:Cytochrome c class I n=2 Tax=Adhaeribacter arboris TaxID=2072846 RepID=A0A2T2YMT5_9BACT|nr:cytochrome c class I [Adhaeribacter arboris]